MKLREVATIKRQKELIFKSHRDGTELTYIAETSASDDEVLEEVRRRFGDAGFDIIERYTLEKLMTI